MSGPARAEILDWADDMAIGFIVEATSKSGVPARREIARRLRALQAACSGAGVATAPAPDDRAQVTP